MSRRALSRSYSTGEMRISGPQDFLYHKISDTVSLPGTIICKARRIKGVCAKLSKARGQVFAHLAKVGIVCVAQAKHSVSKSATG